MINTENKANAISTKLMELNFKNKLEDEGGEKTGETKKPGRKKHRKQEETG